MRYPAGHKQEARARIVAAAGRGFRKRGYGGIGVDGLAKEAEVTSGAFYGHFASKDAAFREAVVTGLDELHSGILALRAEHGAGWIEVFVDFYLGQKRFCDLGVSCALQSLSPDVQRAGVEIRSAFQEHVQRIAQAIAEGLPGADQVTRMGRAWALLSVLTGGVTLARSVADGAVSDQISVGLRAAALAIGRAA